VSPFGWVAVGLLGGAAAGARYLLDAEVSHRTDGHFPLGILAVNLIGAFALGLVAGSALRGEALTIVAGGAIGSFTTFSTWMLDTHLLGAAERAHLAWLNIGVSVGVGFAAVSLGHWLATGL
jgi:fluoride exporter